MVYLICGLGSKSYQFGQQNKIKIKQINCHLFAKINN